MSKENTAVFIGHNECYGVTSEQIKEAIVSLIDKGVTDFLSGGQGGFDRLCGRCVYEVKKQYPNINNYLVIPYLSFNVYNSELFDSIIYPDDFEKYHFKAAIPARNKFMVDNASYAICFVNHGWGGAAKTYERAKKKGLNIINKRLYHFALLIGCQVEMIFLFSHRLSLQFSNILLIILQSSSVSEEINICTL